MVDQGTSCRSVGRWSVGWLAASLRRWPEFVDSRFQHTGWPWPRRTIREVIPRRLPAARCRRRCPRCPTSFTYGNSPEEAQPARLLHDSLDTRKVGNQPIQNATTMILLRIEVIAIRSRGSRGTRDWYHRKPWPELFEQRDLTCHSVIRLCAPSLIVAHLHLCRPVDAANDAAG